MILFFHYTLQESESLTREQLEEEIQKIKKEHAEDEGTLQILT